MTYFYTKYIFIESLTEELHSLDLSDEERYHLASLVDSNLHNVILDEILSNLSREDKKAFLYRLKENPEDEKIMEFLAEKIDGVEERIKKAADDLVGELHKDIREAKKLNSSR